MLVILYFLAVERTGCAESCSARKTYWGCCELLLATTVFNNRVDYSLVMRHFAWGKHDHAFRVVWEVGDGGWGGFAFFPQLSVFLALITLTLNLTQLVILKKRGFFSRKVYMVMYSCMLQMFDNHLLDVKTIINAERILKSLLQNLCCLLYYFFKCSFWPQNTGLIAIPDSFWLPLSSLIRGTVRELKWSWHFIPSSN